VKLAAVQYRPPKGDPPRARAELADLVARAGRAGARLVVCPEMATSGYVWRSPDEVRPHAEPAAGPTLAALGPVAARHGCFVVCGFPELDPQSGALYNAALVVGPDGGLLAVYRKLYLYVADTTWARPGDRAVVLESPVGRIAPAICMDINSWFLPRLLVDHAVEVLAFCTNWVDEGGDVHGYWRERLQGWSGLMVAGNSWGEDRGTRFSGRSAVLGPGGVVLGALPAEGDDVLVVDADAA
jgi:predicted amidohydrolase